MNQRSNNHLLHHLHRVFTSVSSLEARERIEVSQSVANGVGSRLSCYFLPERRRLGWLVMIEVIRLFVLLTVAQLVCNFPGRFPQSGGRFLVWFPQIRWVWWWVNNILVFSCSVLGCIQCSLWPRGFVGVRQDGLPANCFLRPEPAVRAGVCPGLAPSSRQMRDRRCLLADFWFSHVLSMPGRL